MILSEYWWHFSVVVLLAFLGLVVSSSDSELDKHRALESFVELKGGEFLMGVNDREGVNNEYPQRKAIVAPFRLVCI